MRFRIQFFESLICTRKYCVYFFLKLIEKMLCFISHSQKGYYQPIQNDDRELNSSPQQANNSPGEPENGKNPPAPQNSRNPKAPQNNQNQPSKACTKPKPFVKNAFKKCSTTTNTCTVQCFNNHQFANGKTSVKLLCNNGEWALENFQKTDKLACEGMTINQMIERKRIN